MQTFYVFSGHFSALCQYIRVKMPHLSTVFHTKYGTCFKIVGKFHHSFTHSSTIDTLYHYMSITSPVNTTIINLFINSAIGGVAW